MEPEVGPATSSLDEHVPKVVLPPDWADDGPWPSDAAPAVLEQEGEQQQQQQPVQEAWMAARDRWEKNRQTGS